MNRFLQLGVNKEGRDFVIGDIHGKYNLLMAGLARVGFNFDKDRLIAVGDLIDRGKQNMECLDLIGQPWFHTVVGNHEVMMQDAMQGNGMAMWTMNGGAWFYNLDCDDLALIKDHYVPLIDEHMPYALEFIAENGKRVGVTHTDTPDDWPWGEVREYFVDYTPKMTDYILQHVLWSRTKIGRIDWKKEVLGVDLMVHGHTPSKKPVWRANTVFIDQGAHNPYQMIPINVMDLFNTVDKAKVAIVDC